MLARLAQVVGLTVAGDRDQRGCATPIAGADLTRRRVAVHAWHGEIEQHHLRTKFGPYGQCIGSGVGNPHVVAFEPQHDRAGIGAITVVVRDKYPQAAGAIACHCESLASKSSICTALSGLTKWASQPASSDWRGSTSERPVT